MVCKDKIIRCKPAEIGLFEKGERRGSIDKAFHFNLLVLKKINLN